MKIFSGVATFVILIIAGCSSHEKAVTLKDTLVGEWRNIYLRIAINEMSEKDSVRITECDSTNWEAMLKIKPIHTFFKADGSYRSDYYTLKDSLFMSNTGTWTIIGDTLTMNQLTPKPGVYKLKTTVKERVATFEGMIDFDQDGNADDHYLGWQRKQ
ncbi:MAG TPA: hypothetical protein PLR06_00360 [Cyclobacteriaceae bacterium]|nr:hypothetical protein [Cyclobacteriaceae bacterium]